MGDTAANIVKNHNVLPSFANNTYNISINEQIVLNDLNGVLKDYDISTNKDIDITKDDNKIIINAKEEDNVEIFLTKKDKKYNTPPVIYVSNTSWVYAIYFGIIHHIKNFRRK